MNLTTRFEFFNIITGKLISFNNRIKIIVYFHCSLDSRKWSNPLLKTSTKEVPLQIKASFYYLEKGLLRLTANNEAISGVQRDF